MTLSNKTLLFVGGTSGMGLSAARACAALGANVVLVGRNRERADHAADEIGRSVDAPARVKAFAADALDPPAIPEAVAFAVATFGRLDGLFHSAGGSGRKLGDGPLHEITDSGWRSTVDWNLTTLFHSNRAAVNQFLKQGPGPDGAAGGAIVNVGSILAQSPSPAFFATHAYAAAKSAIVGFTRACASYYAPHGVRFNLLVPSLVETPMSQRSTANPQIMGLMRTKQPLTGGAAMSTRDVDPAAVYLLSDASRCMTGQVLTIDAGWGVSEGQLAPPNDA